MTGSTILFSHVSITFANVWSFSPKLLSVKFLKEQGLGPYLGDQGIEKGCQGKTGPILGSGPIPEGQGRVTA